MLIASIVCVVGNATRIADVLAVEFKAVMVVLESEIEPEQVVTRHLRVRLGGGTGREVRVRITHVVPGASDKAREVAECMPVVSGIQGSSQIGNVRQFVPVEGAETGGILGDLGVDIGT